MMSKSSRYLLVVLVTGGAALAASPWAKPWMRAGGTLLALAGVMVAVLVVRRRAPATDESTDNAGPTEPEENRAHQNRSAGRIVGRRDAIKMLGIGFVGAIPAMASGGLVETMLSTAAAPSPVPASFRGAKFSDIPATTKDGRIRQWTMIIDLRKCDGCQSQGTPPQCTTACIEGEFLPQPMEWIEVYEGDLPGGGTQFIPTPCQQCQNPPCVNVCPVGATFSTPEGTVLVDQERCIGCRICMAACPYDRRFFNWGEPPVPPEALLADYKPDNQTPARRGTVMKCDFCPDMVRDGTLPFCVQACPNNAIWYGDLEENIATNGRELVSATRLLSENSGYRQKEELGTEPRVYYIPGHGEDVGRDVFSTGRLPTEWPWVERAEGAAIWTR